MSNLSGVASVAVDAATAAPSLYTVSGTKYLFTAASTKVYKINTDFSPASSLTLTNTAVYGRASVLLGVLYFVDDSGKLWAVDVDSLSQTWAYQDTSTHGSCFSGNNCEARNLYFDVLSQRVYFGDKDGHVYAVSRNGSGGQLMWSSPFSLSGSVFQSAPLYRSGVIAIGSTAGKVFFLDQRSTSAAAPSAVAALIRSFSFGSSVAINNISYDHDGGQYIVATSDGKLYYIHASLVADPTSSYVH
jgi:outer membrane protein assembly factor BamB